MRGGSAWLLGFAAGIAGTLALLELAMIGAMTYVVMLLWLARVRAIPTFGGAFTTTGLWFVFLWSRSLAQCAAFNANGGFCAIYDAWIGGAIALGFLVVGVILSGYAVVRARA